MYQITDSDDHWAMRSISPRPLPSCSEKRGSWAAVIGWLMTSLLLCHHHTEAMLQDSPKPPQRHNLQQKQQTWSPKLQLFNVSLPSQTKNVRELNGSFLNLAFTFQALRVDVINFNRLSDWHLRIRSVSGTDNCDREFPDVNRDLWIILVLILMIPSRTFSYSKFHCFKYAFRCKC